MDKAVTVNVNKLSDNIVIVVTDGNVNENDLKLKIEKALVEVMGKITSSLPKPDQDQENQG